MAQQSSILGRLGFVKSPGAPVPHRKHTSECETVQMPVPAQVKIVMSMHIGAPCTPCVKPKDQPVMPSKEGRPLRKGIKTTIRNILQESHFVTLDTEKAMESMPVIEDLLKEVYADDLAMSKDLIEARSAVTVAYIVLNEDIENARNNN